MKPGASFSTGLTATEAIPQSHKIALRNLEPGESVLRYGAAIGYANRPIRRGSWVREDFLDMPAAPPLDEFPLATAVPESPPALVGCSFDGYRNPDGSVGTRNILGITTTVQCVAPPVDYAVQRIRSEILPRFPNVDRRGRDHPHLRVRGSYRRTGRGDSHPHPSVNMAAFNPNFGGAPAGW